MTIFRALAPAAHPELYIASYDPHTREITLREDLDDSEAWDRAARELDAVMAETARLVSRPHGRMSGTWFNNPDCLEELH